jgi:predicted transcriptional regulator YdeE
MNPNTIHHESAFNVVGIAIRTTNKAAAEEASIVKLWQQFFMDQCLAKIDNKIDNSIIALYYNFETDKNAVYLEGSQGEYTVLIGARVSSLDTIAPGFMGKHVEAEQRMIFTSEIGSAQNIVFDLWKKIWTEQKQNQLNRTFAVDYELYDERSHNPENAQMEIHIGIK